MKRFFLPLVLALAAAVQADELRMIGMVASHELVTVPVNEQGEPVRPPVASWVPVVELDKPVHDASTQTAEPALVWFADRVERQWTLRSLTARELAANAEAAGYTVQPEGWVLPLGKSDRNSFTQMLLLVTLSKQAGAITDETPQKITDKYGQPHVLSTARYIEVMLSYGAYYKALWDNQI